MQGRMRCKGSPGVFQTRLVHGRVWGVKLAGRRVASPVDVNQQPG